MNSPAANLPFLGTRIVPRWEAYLQVWEAWREPIAGACIAAGLCGSFVLPSLLPALHWWYVIPLAMLGALVRQRKVPGQWTALVPLWGFVAIFLLFVIYAAALSPLSAYGREKTVNFLAFALAAYLGARRQPPLTDEFVKGVRWGLIASLGMSLLVVYQMRDLFMEQQLLGIQQLKLSVAMTVLPLVTAMAMAGFIPRTTRPGYVLLGGAMLLAGAALEVFERGRFHALLLCGLAVLLVLGPPWRNIFLRVMACGVLIILGLAIFINVLPLMGDSFLYLTWMDPGSLAGRGPAWTIALDGFWAHPLGQGIGSFEIAGGQFAYPHNIILEAAFEMGILGLVSIGALYVMVLRRVGQLWLIPAYRVMAALTLMVFLHMLKSGDISTIGFHWVFLYLLVVASPSPITWHHSARRAEE